MEESNTGDVTAFCSYDHQYEVLPLRKIPSYYIGTSDLTPKAEDDLGVPPQAYEAYESEGRSSVRLKSRTLDDWRAALWEVLYRLRLFPEAGSIPDMDVFSLSRDEIETAFKRYSFQLLSILGPRHEAQLAREDEALNKGIKQYREQVEKKMRTGRASESGIGESMIGRYVDGMAELVLEFVASPEKPGPFARAQRVLKDIEPEVAAYITVKLALDTVLQADAKATKMHTVAKRIGDAIIAEVLLSNTPFENSGVGIGLARARAKHERGNSKRAREGRAKNDRKLREEVERLRRESKEREEAVKAGKQFLKFEDNDNLFAGYRMLHALFSVAENERSENGHKEPAFFGRLVYQRQEHKPKILYAAQWLIDEYLDRHWRGEEEHAHVRPMLIFPSPWKLTEGNIGILPGGYRGALRDPQRGRNLVKTSNPKHIEQLNHAVAGQDSLLHRTVHGLQNTAFRINKRVLAALEIIQQERFEASFIAPTNPRDRRDFEEKTKEGKRQAWAKWFKKEWAKSKAASLTIKEAKDNREEPVLFFPHTFDFRGRVYPDGGYLSPQGNDLTRSLLEFAEGKRLGAKDAVKALAVHGANCYGNGIDKMPLADRIQWVKEYKSEIQKIAEAETPLDSDLWREASDKWQFLAFCYDWRDCLKHGINHISHLPVYTDGTCNGYQHFAALMRDRELGKLVGMTDPDEGEDRTDLYTAVACAVESKIKADAQEDNDIAVRIIRAVIAKPKDRSGFTLGRDLAKKPIMTFGYGVVSYGMCDALMKKLRDDHSEGKIPDEQWEILAESRTFVNKEGEETEGDYLWSICQYLTKLFFDVIKTKISGAANARDWLEKVGKQLAGCGGNGGPSAIQWRSPSKFPVLAVKRKSIPKSIESEMFGKRYIISAYEHTDEVDAGRTASGFPPNMIHSLDAAHLMFTIDRCLSEGMRSFVTTHDCFGCLATDMPRMGQIIRESFVDMYRKLDMTALGGLLSQDNNKDLSTIENPKQTNDLKLDDVLGSEFFFS